MRYAWVIMIALLLGATGFALHHAQRERASVESAEARTSGALSRIGREIRIRAGTAGAALNGRGWPATIDPAWFGGKPPQNALVGGDRPWLEVASPDQHALTHPPVRQALDGTCAAFWYNPGNGFVRARVGVRMSDRAAIEAYNRVNGANISALAGALDASK